MGNAYPLDWPNGWPRTKAGQRRRSQFGVSFARARDGVIRELELMEVPDSRVVISSNITLRRDGLPYANQREPEDVGVAVYWTSSKDEARVIACDRWDRTRDNLRAIAKTLDAMRGIDRWGSSDIVDRAFRGFAALPPATDWRAIMGIGAEARLSEAFLRERYRILAQARHPDACGTHEEMVALNSALDEGLKEIR